MRLLHTSDWHLGCQLFRRTRYDEGERFLDWLSDCIEDEHVDVLLVAGDVFDTGTPSNRAMSQYYRFLCRVAESNCRHVVVLGGNHDSPSLLEAPRDLLAALRVHVVGAARADIGNEVLVLDDADGSPGLIVCAVPYLRDRDVRVADSGESLATKESKVREGIRRHYRSVLDAALARREAEAPGTPIIATGHLFTVGGRTTRGDGVRQLYLQVGELGQVGGDVFPPEFAYVALGHLHAPQCVGGDETRRYSGAPIPMGFGEINQTQSVSILEFTQAGVHLRELAVPRFQELRRLSGDLPEILTEIANLVGGDSAAWLEISYEGDTIVPDLKEQLDAAVADSRLEILRVSNRPMVDRMIARTHVEETLDELTPQEVFHRRLDAADIPADQRRELVDTFHEVLSQMQEEDGQAE